MLLTTATNGALLQALREAGLVKLRALNLSLTLINDVTVTETDAVVQLTGLRSAEFHASRQYVFRLTIADFCGAAISQVAIRSVDSVVGASAVEDDVITVVFSVFNTAPTLPPSVAPTAPTLSPTYYPTMHPRFVTTDTTGPAASIALQTRGNLRSRAGMPFPQQPSVAVLDSSGTVVSGLEYSIAATLLRTNDDQRLICWATAGLFTLSFAYESAGVERLATTDPIRWDAPVVQSQNTDVVDVGSSLQEKLESIYIPLMHDSCQITVSVVNGEATVRRNLPSSSDAHCNTSSYDLTTFIRDRDRFRIGVGCNGTLDGTFDYALSSTNASITSSGFVLQRPYVGPTSTHVPMCVQFIRKSAVSSESASGHICSSDSSGTS